MYIYSLTFCVRVMLL